MKTQTENSKYQFSGSLSKYQETSRKPYTKYEQDKYTQYQNYLYKRALYGLKSLSKEEIDSMSEQKLKRIKRVNRKAQSVINVYKQKITILYSNILFEKFFPNSPYTEFLLNNTETDTNFINKLNFKDLNIHKDDIIKVFIEEGVLPKNFMEIKINPHKLPRLKHEI